jgi:predicted phage tail protein
MGIATATRLAGPAALALVVVLSGTQDAVAASRPSAPRSVAAKPGNTTVRVSWAAPSSTGGAAIDRYAVQRAASATGTWTTVAKPAATSRAWTNTGLVNGHRYYYRVRAHNVVGWSLPSTTVTAVPRTVPSAPQSPAAAPGNTSVQVTWTKPASNGGAAIDTYAVQRLDGTWSTVAQVSATTFASTVSGLTNGTSYSFRVRAHNVAGWGAPSATVSAVPRTVPSAPRSPAVTTGDGSATVSWLAPSSSGGSAIDEYQVQYSTDDATWSSLSATAAQTQLTANGLQNGATFHFRVRAHNGAGWGPASSEVSATPGLPLPPTQVQGQSSASGVNFSWTLSATASPAVTGYEVEISTDPSILWNVVHVSSSTTQYALT